MDYIDLHVHSTCSDGTMTPAQLVTYAIQKGLKAIALTDHDTTDGIAQARLAAANSALLVIPGIELSTEYAGGDVHIVGLDIDEAHPAFRAYLAAFYKSRDARNEKMITALAHRFDISLEKLSAAYPNRVLTRAHIADYLYRNGDTNSVGEAFEKYIGEGCPYFVPREKITPTQAIAAIHESGGYAVLAHPMCYHLGQSALGTLTATLKKAGLDAIEVLYSTYSPQEEAFAHRLADTYDLSYSGGSDFHGTIKPDIDLGSGRGNLRIPYSFWANLRSRHNVPLE